MSVGSHLSRKWWVYLIVLSLTFYVVDRPHAKQVVALISDAAIELWHDVAPLLGVVEEGSEKAGHIKKNLQGEKDKSTQKKSSKDTNATSSHKESTP